MFVVNLIIGLLVFYVLPTFIICQLIKKVIKKKLSKGWSILVFVLCCSVSTILCISFLSILNIDTSGGHIGFLELFAVWGVVSLVLYDKDADTFLDTEKEILRKKQLKEEKTNNETIDENTPYYYAVRFIENYSNKFNCVIFNQIIDELRNTLSKNKSEINKNVAFYNDNKNINIKAINQMVVSVIIQTLDMKLTSGDYHIYRGVLDNNGKKLLNIYGSVQQELLKLDMMDEDTKKPIDEDWIKKQYKSLLADIHDVG